VELFLEERIEALLSKPDFLSANCQVEKIAIVWTVGTPTA